MFIIILSLAAKRQSSEGQPILSRNNTERVCGNFYYIALHAAKTQAYENSFRNEKQDDGAIPSGWLHALPGADRGEDAIQNDSNGSAKIALIGLDRLIGAWSVLMENMKDHEDEILKFLLELASVRKSTEETFPDARKFVRPGFDELRQ